MKRTDARRQFNVRLPEDLEEKLSREVQRQGRKRDFVARRIFEHFLSLKNSEREAICTRAA